tara:strand:- start:688 stop:852 length:165 start_codon:yes stop_codon:yes gene_type:complete
MESIFDIQMDLESMNKDYQVFVSVTNGIDLHDSDGNWIDTFEDSSELLFWVTNN